MFDFIARDWTGNEISLASYEGQVLLVVNIAFRYGMKPAFEDLDALHRRYHERGFSVLGFPTSEFTHNGVDEHAAEALVSQVTFPLFAEVKVRGEGQSTFFAQLVREAEHPNEIHGDFQKFLLNRAGQVAERFGSGVRALDERIARKIEALLAEQAPKPRLPMPSRSHPGLGK